MFRKFFLLFMVAAFPAYAESGFYTRFDAAYVNPVEKGGRDGYAWRSGFGWRLAPHLRAEMTAGYARTNIGNGFHADFSHGRLSVAALSANAVVDLFTLAGATPFVFGGVGLSKNRTRPSDIGPVAVAPRRRRTLARQAGAGIAFALPEDLTLDIGFAYVNNGRFGLTSAESEKLHTRQVFIGVRYDFRD